MTACFRAAVVCLSCVQLTLGLIAFAFVFSYPCNCKHRVAATEVGKRESRGGIGFDLVLEEPSCEAPKVKNVTSPIRQISAEEIEAKLKAAEERRKSIEAEKLKQLKEKEAQILEMRNKRNELESSFKDNVRESLDKKMETFKENRENAIRTVLDKLQEHDRHIDDVRKNRESVSTESNGASEAPQQ